MEVTVHNSTGYGVNATLILGSSSISRSTFAYNAGTTDYYGGNVHLFYKNCPAGEISYLHINSSQFLYGKNQHESGFLVGLSLAVHCINTKIIITDSFLRGNTAYNDGGNLALSFINTTHQFPSNALTLSNSNIEDGVSYRGGGMFIKILQASSGGNIIYENCKFYSNSAHVGGAAVYITTLKVPGYMPHGIPQLHILFKKCEFIQSNPHSIQYVSAGAVLIYEVDSVEFLGCSFEDNNSTALIASHSNIIFRGSVRIDGKHWRWVATLWWFTHVLEGKHHSLIFTNNKVLHSGGGIYVEDDCMQPIAPCFFQFHLEYLERVHVEIINNTALCRN